MAEPATLGNAGMTLTGAGTGINVMSKLLGAGASRRQFMYQSHVATLNSKIAEQNAQWARDAGEKENQQFGMKAAQRAGQIKVAQAASGIDVNSAGPEAVRQSQATVDKMDREQLLENAARRAYGHDMEAYSQKTKSAAYRSAAKNADAAGVVGAMTSLVSGATSVADKWYQGKIHGMWDTEEDGSVGWGKTAKFGA